MQFCMGLNHSEALASGPSTTNKAPPRWNCFETLPSEYHGYHPASHCPCLVPTYERNQSPLPRMTFHPPTPSRDFLLSKFTGLPFRYSIGPRSENVPHSSSSTGRGFSSDGQRECEHFKPQQIRIINYCRLFLQVHTIADLAMAGGHSRRP
jgi:hypothetical protein